MAYYTTEATLRLTKWDASEVTATQLTNYAKMAYDVINAKLAKRYSVPFAAPVPGVIVEISDMLVVYYGKLYSAGHVVASEALDRFRDEAFRLLDALAEGEIGIPGVATRSVGAYCSDEGYHKVMTILPTEEQGPDTDLLDKLRDERED